MNTILHTSKESFEDMTIGKFECKYPEEDFVGNHKFKHLAGGLYMADPEFVASEKEMCKIFKEYTQIVFLGEMRQNEAVPSGLSGSRVLSSCCDGVEGLAHHAFCRSGADPYFFRRCR
jgi:hypothetical protein